LKDTLVRGLEDELARKVERLERELVWWRTVYDSARLLVGHELVKPMTSISGYLDLLENDLADTLEEKQRHYIERMRASLERLEIVADSFVQMLLIDRGSSKKVGEENISVGEVIGKITEDLEQQGGEFEVVIDESIPPVSLRRRYLEIVLENVLSNAVKHGDASGIVKVEARLQNDRRGDSRERFLFIKVENQTEDISTGKLERFFEPFYRVKEDEEDGMGLGLALVKNLVLMMGGRIAIRGEERGIVVTLAIPIMENKTSEEE